MSDETCTCGSPQDPNCEGPEQGCPQHGDVRWYAHLLSEANATIERVRTLLPKWQADRVTYPVDDIRASVAFLAVKACEEELKAAIEDPS